MPKETSGSTAAGPSSPYYIPPDSQEDASSISVSIEESDEPSVSYEVVEEEDVDYALVWENREDFATYGKLKSIGGAAAGVVLGKIAPPLGGTIAALRLAKTINVLGALEALRNGTLSAKAKEDVEYIVKKKHQKVVKAALAMSPDPIVSKAPLAWNMAGVRKRDRGKLRTEVATRIYSRIKAQDDDYFAIVFALFKNKQDPGRCLQRLLTTTNETLAIKVLMGKIASR